MQSEIIYVPNTKVMLLERYFTCFKGTLSEKIIKINEAEILGRPFSIITRKKFSNFNLFASTPEFKELINQNPLTSSLGYYLRQAEIEHTLSKKEDNTIQYLGIINGKPATIKVITDFNNPESEIERYVVSCQFYLIKDKISKSKFSPFF
jgi:hypothetical protein